jgi:hypothetical protein
VPPVGPAVPPLPVFPPSLEPPSLEPPSLLLPPAFAETHSSLRHCSPLAQLPSSHGHLSDPIGQLEVVSSVVPAVEQLGVAHSTKPKVSASLAAYFIGGVSTDESFMQNASAQVPRIIQLRHTLEQ